MNPLWIGSFGVLILLTAFALNIIGKLTELSPMYLTMNIIGALLAGYYAVLDGIIPFIVLEFVWAAAALARLIMVIKKAPIKSGSL